MFRRNVSAGVVASLFAFAVPAHAQSVTAYEGARLIVGDGRVIENATLVVNAGRIAQAGAAAEVKVPANAQRVNLSGKTVMPTIIDTHVHLSNLPDQLLRDLRQRAFWGVSAAMSMGTDPYAVLELRAQTVPGRAKFQSAGRGITAPEPGRITLAHQITTPEQGRKIVEELAAQRVDIVKIWVDSRDGKFTKLSPEIYGAIIDEAHKRKLRVAAHLFDLEDAKGLLRAGVDSLAHGIRDRDIDEEIIALFKQRPNLVLIPNLPDRGVKADLSWLRGGMTDAELAKLEEANADRPQAQRFFGIQSRNLGKLAAAGVKITLGTDGNRAWGPHEEMQDMVFSGMTPMQVIVAATKNGAEFMNLADAGTLQPGKSADFLVLDANPLEDITHTRRISSVILRGAAVDRSTPPK
jgi:imidazolonepropionase-like amidohydrolase